MIIFYGYRVETDEELHGIFQYVFQTVDSILQLERNPEFIDTRFLPRFSTVYKDISELIKTDGAKRRYDELIKECKLKGLTPYRRLSDYCFACIVVPTKTVEYRLIVLVRNELHIFKELDLKKALHGLHNNLEDYVRCVVRYRFSRCAFCGKEGAFKDTDNNFCPRCGRRFEEHYKVVVYGVREA